MTDIIKIASWYKRIVMAWLKHGAIAVISGTVDNMRSFQGDTGYNRHFVIRWDDVHKGNRKHLEFPVRSFNQVARQVKEDGYKYGDKVDIIGKFTIWEKESYSEMYIELIDIQGRQ
jgi:hypothetical protein